MNLNENLVKRNRGRGRKNPRASYNVLNIYKRPEKASNCLENSDTKWGNSRESIQNVSLSSVRKSSASYNSTDESESRIIVALTEGRGDASCEVGIAAICVSKPLLILCQISDSQSYINTLSKLNLFDPNEILVPNTFINRFSGNRLVDKIKNHFPNIKLLPVPRNTFNKGNGIDICSSICLPNMNGILLMLQHRYYALSAVSALVTYVQENFHTYYAPGTVKIEYQESEGYSIIDIATADHLELVCSAHPQQSSKYSNLFGILNHCATKIGKRTLRSCILQPPCDVTYMEERLDCVSELVDHPDILISIQTILQKIANIDQLLSIGTIIPSDPQKCSNRQLNYMLVLNNFIELISPLTEILSNLERPFFVNLKQTLERDEFEKIKKIIRENIQESAHPAKGQNGIAQRCFAIKPNVNGLLDLVRKTYTERMNDMREYVKELARKHDLPLTLNNNQTKGYHIVLSLNKHQRKVASKSDLPSEFIQVNRLAGSFTMKTPELMNLSTRLDDIMADILKLSNVMVHSFINEIKQYAHLFYILCEKVALLDVLQSLAETSVTNGYVRPQFGQYTEVIDARHPLLDFLLPVRPMPNSIYCSDDYNAHIITGPNGAGKSIFIRQVLLLQVMAQVGCYVPARSAVFRPADRMYARIYFGDYMECSASSFILEMREINYIMSTMTKDSLIIIDELGRSTSLEEGTALAMAIVEKIAQSEAYLYITTHFVLLTRLYDLYPNIKLWQLETVPSGEDPNTFELDYRFQLIPGVTTVRRYGIYMVRNIWSNDVMRYIDEILARITKKPRDPKTAGLSEGCRFKYEVESQCRALKHRHMLTAAQLNALLEAYYEYLRHLGYPLVAEDVLVNYNESRDDFRLDPRQAAGQSLVSREAEMELLDAGLQAFTPEPAAPATYGDACHDASDDSIRCRTVTDFQDMMVPEVQLVEGENSLSYGRSSSSGPHVAYRPSPLTDEQRNILLGHEREGSQVTFSVPNISILNTTNVSAVELESLKEDLEVCSRVFSTDDGFGEPEYPTEGQINEGATFFEEFGGRNLNAISAVASNNFGSPKEQYFNATNEFPERPREESDAFYTVGTSCDGYNELLTGEFGSFPGPLFEELEIPQTTVDAFSSNGIFQSTWRQFDTFPKTTKTLDEFGDVPSTTFLPPPSSDGFETRTHFNAFTTTDPTRDVFSTITSPFNNFATPGRHLQAFPIEPLQTPQRNNDSLSMVASPPSDFEIRKGNFQERGGNTSSAPTSTPSRAQLQNSLNAAIETTPKKEGTVFPRNQSRASTGAPTRSTKLEVPNNNPVSPSHTFPPKHQFPKKSHPSSKSTKPIHIFPKVIILEGPNDLSISIEEQPPPPKVNIISNVLLRAAQEETKTPTDKYDDMCTDMSLLRVQSHQYDDMETDSDKTIQDSDHQSEKEDEGIVSKLGSNSSKVNAAPKMVNKDMLERSYSSENDAATISDDDEPDDNTTLEHPSGFQSSGTTNDGIQPSIHSGCSSRSQKYPSTQYNGNRDSFVGKDEGKKATTSISEASRLRNLERISSESSALDEKNSPRSSDKQPKDTSSISKASKMRNLEKVSSACSSSACNEEKLKNVDRTKNATNISDGTKQSALEKTPTSDLSTENFTKRPNDDQKNDTSSTSEASKLRNLEKDSSSAANEGRKCDERMDDTTSVSEASKQRDLEKTPISEKLSSCQSTNAENFSKRPNVDQKKDTSSTSEASKLRNLEKVSSSDTNEGRKCDEHMDDTTSLSEASKQRDLEKSSTTPTSEKISSSVSSASRKRSIDTYSSTPGAVKKTKVLRKSAKPAAVTKSSSDDSRKFKRRFVPPRRLTAKEIQEEFHQQDRKLLETMSEVSDMSRYYEQIINRPSVKQVQNATQLALIKKTQEGYEVIPAAAAAAQKSGRKRPRSVQARISQEAFNLSIFSDQNAKMFEEYAKSNEKNYNVFSCSNATNEGRMTMETFMMGVATHLAGSSAMAVPFERGVDCGRPQSSGMARSSGISEAFGMAGNPAMSRYPTPVEDIGRISDMNTAFGMAAGSGMPGNPCTTEAFGMFARQANMTEDVGMAGASGVSRHPSGMTGSPVTNEAFVMAASSGMPRNPSTVETFGIAARHPSTAEDFGMAGAFGMARTVPLEEPYTSSVISSGLFRKEEDRPFKLDASLTPEGYYKRNKDDVNRIMNKYLRQSSQCGRGSSTGNLFEDIEPIPEDVGW